MPEIAEQVEIGTVINEAAPGQRAVQRKTAVWHLNRVTCDELLSRCGKKIAELAVCKEQAEKADELSFWTVEERAQLVNWGILK
jgi:hypothetical protein